MKKSMRVFDALAVSATVSFFVVVAIPLQTYLSNRASFSYGTLDLLLPLSFIFLGVTVSAGLLVFCSSFLTGRFVHVCLIGTWLWFYLQTAVLGIGLPQIDGAIGDLFRPSIRRYSDFLAVVFIFGMVIGWRKFAMKWLLPISGAALILSLSFLFDYGKEAEGVNGGIDIRFARGITYPERDVPLSAVYSAERNILFIVLDNFPADIAADAFDRHPELMELFPGFMFFKNNIGMHESTARGVTALATGRYLEKDMRQRDWQNAFYGNDSFLSDYLDAGYAMYVVPSLIKPFTNRRLVTSSVEATEDSSKTPLLRYSNHAPYVTLWDIVAYRVAFWKKKAYLIQDAMARGEKDHKVRTDGVGNVAGLCQSEGKLFPFLSNRPLESSVRASFHFYHLPGTHFPIYLDGEGGGREDLESMRNYAPHVLKPLAAYFEIMRARGIYDKTMVVITTDHGVMTYAVLPEAKSALLMVKPFGSDDVMRIVDYPTSHANIAAMMRRAVRENLCEADIEKCLYAEKRKIRVKQKSPEKWWQFGRLIDTYDIFYDEHGEGVSRVNLGQFETF